MQSDARANWDAVEAEYRDEWAARYAPTGMSWQAAKPAFRFGWECAYMPGYARKTWLDVVDDLALHWYMPLEASEEMAWDNVHEVVRDGWERAQQMIDGSRPASGLRERFGAGRARASQREVSDQRRRLAS